MYIHLIRNYLICWAISSVCLGIKQLWLRCEFAEVVRYAWSLTPNATLTKSVMQRQMRRGRGRDSFHCNHNKSIVKFSTKLYLKTSDLILILSVVPFYLNYSRKLLHKSDWIYNAIVRRTVVSLFRSCGGKSNKLLILIAFHLTMT